MDGVRDKIETDKYCLLLGDCLDVLPTLQAGSVVSDPPYGVNNNCDYTRFTGGLAPNHHHHHGIYGDDTPFDPSPWLAFPEAILWGYQHFAKSVPVGTILVWNKKATNQLGTFLSDCELAWMKGGVGVYLFSHIWHGFDRQTERGEGVLHPSQKPVALMAWCIEKTKGETIIDPYMGSGPTGVACMKLGRRFIGVERDPAYFAIAAQRIAQAAEEPPLFKAIREAEQGNLFAKSIEQGDIE